MPGTLHFSDNDPPKLQSIEVVDNVAQCDTRIRGVLWMAARAARATSQSTPSPVPAVVPCCIPYGP